MAGRGPAELQRSVTDTHTADPLLCRLCWIISSVVSANTRSLSSDLCLSSHLHPFLVYTRHQPLIEVGASSSSCLRAEAMRSPSQLWKQKSNSWARNRRASRLPSKLHFCCQHEYEQETDLNSTGSEPFLTREEIKEGFYPQSSTSGWASGLGFILMMHKLV